MINQFPRHEEYSKKVPAEAAAWPKEKGATFAHTWGDDFSTESIFDMIDMYLGPMLAPLQRMDERAERQDKNGRWNRVDERSGNGRNQGVLEMPAELSSPEMETALIAAALHDPSLFLAEVAPADFLDNRFRDIWRTGQELLLAGEPCDRLLLYEALGPSKQEITPNYLWQLEARDFRPENAPEFAERVHDLGKRRRAWMELQKADRLLRESDGTWTEDLAMVASRLASLAAPPQPDRAWMPTSWSAAELLAATFPEPQWAVPGLIPVGLSFLGGRPKIGKSYLVLQVAIAKGTGGRVFDRPVEQGPALYIALEDNGRRLAERARKQGMPGSALVRFETTWPRLKEGGLAQLEKAIDAEGYKLAVIDTLGRATGRVDTNDYGETTELLGSLQSVALSRDMAILVVDHHRKGMLGVEDDPVDAIVGSTGKSGAADAVLGLSKQQGKPGAHLRVKGREVEELDLVLTWDPALCCWQCQGTAEEVEMSGRRGEVLAALKAAYPDAMLASDIAKATEMQRQNITPLLNDLVRDGQVTKEPKQGKDQPYRAKEGN